MNVVDVLSGCGTKCATTGESAGCCCKVDLNVGGVKVFLLFKLQSHG